MEIYTLDDIRTSDGFAVPALVLSPGTTAGAAVLIHGYGGSKEAMLGLAFHLAEAGITAVAVDLRGHGEHAAALDPGVTSDVEAALAWARRFGPVAALGHSLGGKLALMSDADAVVALSPAIPRGVSPEANFMFTTFPSPRCREPSPAYVLQLLRLLGPVPDRKGPALILCADRDAPAILEGARAYAQGVPSAEFELIDEQTRPDVSLDSPVLNYLPRWLNHAEVHSHPLAARRAAAWLTEKLVRTGSQPPAA